MDTVTAGKTLEQKIHIAAGYDAERVGLIKELILEIANNSWDAGHKRGYSGYPNTENHTKPTKEQYINNLKID
ncbi:MAG TPA: hypothetical protein PLD02_14635 [Saprospiraceae bacterium]|nr:hypothetical protein [Saprospiraceae bacterium]